MLAVRVRCLDCGIFFLTAKANKGRLVLRCPCGCRDHVKQEKSNRRTVEYYRTEEGRLKKKELNRRRQKAQVPPAASRHPEKARLRYYQWLMGMIDGREPTFDEVRELLSKIQGKLRQPSLPKNPKTDKVPDD